MAPDAQVPAADATSSDAQGQDASPPPAGGDGAPDAGPDAPFDPTVPPYPRVGSYQTVLAARSEPADVYYPDPSDLDSNRDAYHFPVIGFLQGANVEKSNYEAVSRGIAAYGFIVVVANLKSWIPNNYYPDEPLSNDILAELKAEAQATTSPVYKVADAKRFGLLGHSYGGVTGVEVVLGQCSLPFCSGTFTAPAELRAGVFYGTNLDGLLSAGSTPDLNTNGIAVALVQGSLDGKAAPADAVTTYDKIRTPPKALMKLAGANHYGVCNANNPDGAAADTNVPTLDHDAGLNDISTWAGLFFRAFLEKNPSVFSYLQTHATSDDGALTVTSVYQ